MMISHMNLIILIGTCMMMMIRYSAPHVPQNNLRPPLFTQTQAPTTQFDVIVVVVFSCLCVMGLIYDAIYLSRF